jgi:hypothetical protein
MPPVRALAGGAARATVTAAVVARAATEVRLRRNRFIGHSS